MDTKLIAVFVVGIMVVAGVSAYVLINNDDGSDIDDESVGRLAVYGNADNNDSIDQKDIDYIQDVIDGKKDRTELCDANHDGKIDAADIQQVKDLIAKKDGTQVHYLDAYNDHQIVHWPANRVSIIFKSVQLIALAAGLTYPQVVAYQIEDPILFAPFHGAEIMDKLGRGGSAPRIGEFEYISSFDPDLIVIGKGTDDPTPEQRKMYSDAGIDLVSVAMMEGEDSIDSILTLGFLCGDMNSARTYAKWCDSMLSAIDEKVATIEEKDKKTAIIWYGGGAIAGKDDGYMKAFERAGGINDITWDYAALSKDNKEWLLEEQRDYIFRVFAMGYNSTPEKREALYDRNIPLIDQTDSYKNGNYWLIDSNIPQILRIAYMGEIMYPEVFGEGFADGWHQQLVDDVYKMDSYDVTGKFTYHR